MRVVLHISITLLLLVLPATAWNSLGHRSVAALAWRQMDAAERQGAKELLKHHPHYDVLLTANVPAGVDKEEWAFLTAAIWPDMVRPAKAGEPPKPRSITRYNTVPHGIYLPFVRPADAARVPLADFIVPTPNAATGLSNSIVTLKNPAASPHDRAVSLGWVLHLMGDLHQPLHAATLVTPEKPRGTGLGGAYTVRGENGKPINLHTYWDRLPGPGGSYADVMALAESLANAPELAPSRLREYRLNKTAADWARESHDHAVQFAYAENRVKFVDTAAVESDRIPRSAIPALQPDYIREAQEVMRRRLALAGQRLADVLKQVW
jgi:hypothetical protein